MSETQNEGAHRVTQAEWDTARARFEDFREVIAEGQDYERACFSFNQAAIRRDNARKTLQDALDKLHAKTYTNLP